MSLPDRKHILILNGDSRQTPWSELSSPPPAHLFMEGWNLSECHLWQPSTPPHIILVDLDVLAQTPGLDSWALKAWRNTFNDLIARATHSDGHSPLLLGYTREPTWERALLGIQIGTRDLAKLSRLSEKIQEILSGKPSTLEEELPTAAAVLSFRKREAVPDQDSAPTPSTIAIPKHAIPFPIEGLEGQSAAIENVRELIRKTAALDTSVLLTGPTGSGKERVARALHRYSPRAAAPFVPVACGAISPQLVESELFGHMKGSFTGAHDDRTGLIVAAQGGTLFLDEISELTLEMQVKLLRVLQERRITPVGSSQSLPIDVRFVTSSQKDLDDAVNKGVFREDLLYRLRVIEITLPSLKERRADIPGLCKTILAKLSKRTKRPLLTLSEAVMEKFLLYTWPGNIRELENCLEHAATLTWAESSQEIAVKSLPEAIQFATMSLNKEHHLKEIIRNFEKEYIASTIRRLGSKEQAAEVLGLSLATLYRKLGNS